MTYPAIAELGTIASLWAHPDDETYVCGGIMAAAAANGQRVTCVSATCGELGTEDPVGWPPDRLGRVRRWEASAAMAVLGVKDHRWLDYPDGGLAGIDSEEPVARIAEILDEVRPDTILTFGPDGGTFHPDHRTISQWVGKAWNRAGRPGRLLHACLTDTHLAEWGDAYERWGVFMTADRPVGVPVEKLALHLTLDGERLDQKITALAAMHTQTAPAMAVLGVDAYRASNAEETFVDATERG
ncbi:PIG-L deacetylase family protein [Hoyosella altamirensis]|nr:PIG-L family deacetylase [Hoyosella altamirensis]